jgi:hypothetical protein
MRSDVHLLPLELPGSNPDFFEIRRIPDFVRRAKDAFPERLQRIEKFLADG